MAKGDFKNGFKLGIYAQVLLGAIGLAAGAIAIGVGGLVVGAVGRHG